MRRVQRTLVVVAFTLASCSSQIVPAATPTMHAPTLRLFATTPVIPLVSEWTAAYSQRYPAVSFEVETGNFETMLEAALAADGGYVISNYLPGDSQLWAAPVGQDGIAVIVHPDNPLDGLRSDELRAIYDGTTRMWSSVGGAEREIVVYSREAGSGTRAAFERLVMGERQPRADAQVAPSSAAMITGVSRTPDAIGYVSMSYLSPSVRALALDGSAPTLAAVAANQYPLRSTLFIIGQREPEETMRGFIGWAQSLDGQTLLSRLYAPLN